MTSWQMGPSCGRPSTAASGRCFASCSAGRRTGSVSSREVSGSRTRTRQGAPILWISCHIPLHIWEFTYDTARRTFERAGFSIAGFRRMETDGELAGKEALLMWPVKPFKLGPIARRFGTNMEFVIRKND